MKSPPHQLPNGTCGMQPHSTDKTGGSAEESYRSSELERPTTEKLMRQIPFFFFFFVAAECKEGMQRPKRGPPRSPANHQCSIRSS